MKHIFVIIYFSSKYQMNPIINFILAAKLITKDQNSIITAIVIGDNVNELISILRKNNFDEIIYSENDLFFDYHHNIVIDQIEYLLAKQEHIDLVLFPNDVINIELASSLSINMNKSFICGAFDINYQNQSLYCKKYIYSNKYILEYSFSEKPIVLTLHINKSQISTFSQIPKEDNCKISKQKIFTDIVKNIDIIQTQSTTNRNNLVNANIIISVGNGITYSNTPNSYELGLTLVNQLASTLGGIVGSSRPLVDKKIVDYSSQIGLSGKCVSPDLYFAIGISGTIQHFAGIVNSKTIIAINNDATSPIFLYSNYGVVADLFKFLPVFIEVIRNNKNNS